MKSFSKHIVVVGTTAAGKSSLAIELAKEFDREIISLDSMQVYKNFEIGTGVVPISEREGVEHHMISAVDPTESYSVSQFKQDVYQILDDAKQSFVFAGGTGLYTHAVVDNFSFAPTDLEVRQRVIDQFELDEQNPDKEKVDLAYSYLEDIDPEAAKKIDPANVRRIARAIEAIWVSKDKFSSTGTGVQTFGKPYLDVKMIGLRYSRDILRERISSRVDIMFRDGWIEECEVLLKIWDQISPTAKAAIGYQPIIDWILAGKNSSSFDDLRTHIINKTAQFSRRQRKWFERDPRVVWIECDFLTDLEIRDSALAQIAVHTSHQ